MWSRTSGLASIGAVKIFISLQRGCHREDWPRKRLISYEKIRGELLCKTRMITQLLAEILREGLCRIILQATASWVVDGNFSRIECKTENWIFLAKVLKRADTTHQSLGKGIPLQGSCQSVLACGMGPGCPALHAQTQPCACTCAGAKICKQT